MAENEWGNVPAYFGINVFNDTVMSERLPRQIYNSLQETINEGKTLGADVAEVVAAAMKDWAVEMGATHFTHWFHPMTGMTAEKHDSFITPAPGGKVIMEFSGKELIRGESDASSFPSGGLRASFEARGYTAWDPTSYAFFKDETLYIPTAFCSYGGEALDKKTPLLRSIQALNKQGLRILRLFGDDATTNVKSTVGAEQEYFLIDRTLRENRMDIKVCGRTLFGAQPAMAQAVGGHYYRSIKESISAYMKELDRELWKLGVYAKTEHNEAAPAQHELAPIFTGSNMATDHNQLTMEMMKKVAARHGFYCLLHEKPFAGVNGSGKHNNWSLSTSEGVNLLDPGDSAGKNARFLLFLCAVIKAVDEYADLLRAAVATAGNDHRLGGFEAPPAIISIFVGDELSAILDAIEHGRKLAQAGNTAIEIGVTVLPKLPKDTTDRNRTSPVAFTGNKFELRMVGAPNSIGCVNYVMNTIVAESLCVFADELEAASDFKSALSALLVRTIKAHKRVLYGGNNYTDEWAVEAEKRGLPNLTDSVCSLPKLIEKKNIALLEKHKVLSSGEMQSRYEILLDEYIKTVHIEAVTMVEMSRRQIIPAVIEYSKFICEAFAAKKTCSEYLDLTAEEALLKKLSLLSGQLYKRTEKLCRTVAKASVPVTTLERAKYYRTSVLTDMGELRAVADELERIVGATFWPFPTYSELLYSI